MAREALRELQIPISTAQGFRVLAKESKEETPKRADAKGSSCGAGLVWGGGAVQETRAPSSFLFQKKVLNFSSRSSASRKIDEEKAKQQGILQWTWGHHYFSFLKRQNSARGRGSLLISFTFFFCFSS